MSFPAALLQEMSEAVLCWLATVSSDGEPNVSPKEVFAPCGDSAMAIADIASPVSVRNIRQTGGVSVAFIDPFRQIGFKITGTACVLAPGDAGFSDLHAPLHALAGDAFAIRNAIRVDIARVARIRAPSLVFHPDRDPVAREREVLRRYGVKRVEEVA